MRFLRKFCLVALAVALPLSATPVHAEAPSPADREFAATAAQHGLTPAELAQAITYIHLVQQAQIALLAHTAEINARANFGDCYAIMEVAGRYFAPGDLDEVAAVMRHESSPRFPVQCLPWIQNQSNHNDSGLMQIRLSVHAWRFAHFIGCSPVRWYDAICNLQVGAELLRDSGGNWTGPWKGAL